MPTFSRIISFLPFCGPSRFGTLILPLQRSRLSGESFIIVCLLMIIFYYVVVILLWCAIFVISIRNQRSTSLFCSFALHLWHEFFNLLRIPIVSNISSILDICDKNWSPQAKVIIQASIVHIINGIWMACNHVRFNNGFSHLEKDSKSNYYWGDLHTQHYF